MGEDPMAKKPTSDSASSRSSSGGLLDIINGITSEMGIEEARSFKPVPTGINVLDYYNARYFNDHETGTQVLFSGMPMGKLIMQIGYTGTHKTTLAVQAAMALVAPFDHGTVFHIDLENAFSKERVIDITGLPMDVVERKYRRLPPMSLDKIYALVKKIIFAKKKAMAEDPSVWVEDPRTGECIPTPTVIIVDTVAALQSETVMNENEEMGSLLFESGSQAKANNAFAQRLAGMIGEVNITLYAVNHLRIDPGPSGGPSKAKRIQYLNQDETCPGGTGFPQFSDYMLKMTPVKMDDGFGIPGKIIRCTVVKTRLSYDGRQFHLVATDNGISNTWTNLLFLKEQKLLKGAGGHLYLEAPDGRVTRKFAQKNWAELYEGDEEFRDIADCLLEAELLKLVPQPGSPEEAEVLAAAEGNTAAT